MTSEPGEQAPAQTTSTLAVMAKQSGMLPSDFKAMTRNVASHPRILIHPSFSGSGWPECDMNCEACQLVDTGTFENITLLAYHHNIRMHGGILDVDPIRLDFSHQPARDTRLFKAWAKWNRGHERLLRLLARCQEWAATLDLVIGSEELVDGWTRWTVDPPGESVPIDFALDLGEAIGQVRSSLDVAVSQLATSPERRNAMPIYDKRRLWDRNSANRLQSLPPRLIDIIEEAQPFVTHSSKPSESLLYRLEDLWNADKHRLLPGAIGALWYARLNIDAPEPEVEKRKALSQLTPFDAPTTLVEMRRTGGGPSPGLSLDFANVRVLFTHDRAESMRTAAAELLDLANAARQLLLDLDIAAGATY